MKTSETNTLYQLNQDGKAKVWIITAKEYSDMSTLTVQSGLVGGSLVTNTKTITEGKNIGKANETNHYEQAVSEMESKIAEKLKKGYTRTLESATSSTVLGSGIPQPMLAQKHSPDGSQSGSKTLAQIGILNKNIIVQPKLDGNRCLIVYEKGKAKMYTRKGDLMPVQLDHILRDVEKNAIDDAFILDGELFSNEFSFNVLNGLIKRVTVTEEDLENRLKIKFNLYDIIINEGYEQRMLLLHIFATKNILIVPSYLIIATDANIKAKLEQFLGEGHEGLMIRQLGIGYENKRTWQLCKVKIFEDAEFKLVGFQEDVRGGFVGAFIMEMADGKTFNAGASGQDVEERTKMWNNQSAYLGKKATIEYFGLSEYGIPRFPKFKGLRD